MSLLVSCDGKLLTSCDGKLLRGCPAPLTFCDNETLLATVTDAAFGDPGCFCNGLADTVFPKNLVLDTMPVALARSGNCTLNGSSRNCVFDGKIGTVEIWRMPEFYEEINCSDATFDHSEDVRLQVSGLFTYPAGGGGWTPCWYWRIYTSGDWPLWQWTDWMHGDFLNRLVLIEGTDCENWPFYGCIWSINLPITLSWWPAYLTETEPTFGYCVENGPYPVVTLEAP